MSFLCLQLLDKNELEHFKKDIRMKKDLRKCSRNFLRFCDENSDTIISLEEWVDCTGINGEYEQPEILILNQIQK